MSRETFSFHSRIKPCTSVQGRTRTQPASSKADSECLLLYFMDFRGNKAENYRKDKREIMREKILRFMQGRHGVDQFAKFTMSAALVCLVLSMFFRIRIVMLILDYTGLVLLGYTYFRVFSRNLQRRSEENRKYLQKTDKIRKRMTQEKRMMEQRKVYHIYKCPECQQKIRIPRGKGKIEISCPKCGKKFIKRS